MSTVDLMAGCTAYVDVAELNVAAVSEAPATTFVCLGVLALESSLACAGTAAAAVSAGGGAWTATAGC